MFVVLKINKSLILGLLGMALFSFTVTSFFFSNKALTSNKDLIDKAEMGIILQELFNYRNRMILNQDLNRIKALYDLTQRLGVWAYEHQARRGKYLHNWADKQGISFISILTKLQVRWVNRKESTITSNLVASTEYKYIYQDAPTKVNTFRIGTYHLLDLKVLERKFLISREWYTDPFADSLNLDSIKTKENKVFINAQSPKDFSDSGQRRLDALAYADKYCGAAADENDGYAYNKKYRDYNPLGGDCANFASQVLYEGGKFRKTGAWNYQRGGTQAWVNAQAFKDYMLGSKRASLLAYGSYDQVLKASYQLLPGDFVAYEKKGRITHISIVTGADTKGYIVVNSHNTDRYHVPWELGWSDRGIKFWLVRVHY